MSKNNDTVNLVARLVAEADAVHLEPQDLEALAGTVRSEADQIVIARDRARHHLEHCDDCRERLVRWLEDYVLDNQPPPGKDDDETLVFGPLLDMMRNREPMVRVAAIEAVSVLNGGSNAVVSSRIAQMLVEDTAADARFAAAKIANEAKALEAALDDRDARVRAMVAGRLRAVLPWVAAPSLSRASSPGAEFPAFLADQLLNTRNASAEFHADNDFHVIRESSDGAYGVSVNEDPDGDLEVTVGTTMLRYLGRMVRIRLGNWTQTARLELSPLGDRALATCRVALDVRRRNSRELTFALVDDSEGAVSGESE